MIKQFATYIFPWIIAAFLGGLLVGKQEVIYAAAQTHKEYAKDTNMRYSILNYAVDSLVDNKFIKSDAIYRAMKAMEKNEKAH